MGVAVGISVAAGVEMGVAVGISVATGVEMGVAVGISVATGVEVGVAVFDGAGGLALAGVAATLADGVWVRSEGGAAVTVAVGPCGNPVPVGVFGSPPHATTASRASAPQAMVRSLLPRIHRTEWGGRWNRASQGWRGGRPGGYGAGGASSRSVGGERSRS